MSLAAFIADQRTSHRVPHTVACRALGVSPSWFYKWQHCSRVPSPVVQRRAVLDTAVAEAFAAAHGLHGSPRIVIDLRAAGWVVSEKTVAKSMARQGLVARPKKRRKNLTRPDKRAVPFPDLVTRDFTAPAPNVKWVGDMTEIPTDEGKLYLSTAIDLFSRRLLGYATSCHPDAELAGQTIKMAVAARGGKDQVAGVIFHSDRGSTYTAHHFTGLCDKLGIVQSMGRTGSCFDNAAAESFFSTLEHEVLSRHHFNTRKEAREAIVKWVVDFYNCRRRHSSCGMQSPIDYETTAADRAA
ncbi:MAG: IS3 family transposase [Labedaea sp.]